MLFCSQHFILFFLTVFTVYWLLPWHRVRVWLLLVASFVFYASWNKWLATLICITTVTDYVVGRALEASSSNWRRRFLLVLSLVINLGILAYFKYMNFFLDSLQQTIEALGGSMTWSGLELILPIGISFYTFEAISYTVDVYQRRIPAERSLPHFMLFILFFPHLIAGPIVRGRDFLPQVRRRKRWNWGRIHLGLQFFLMGMFKKLAIADRMALFADPIFNDPQAYGSTALWLATLAYAIQIYCDFSGYSDMAVGTAHLLGYRLTQNFNMPYLASNISDFWRRWHMSLSSWLRDYLFIPLGGSRGGRWLTCRNLMITMLLGGLWHGAAWTFVVWGVLHGLYLCAYRLFREYCPKLVRPVLDSYPGKAAGIALTFTTVSCTWVLFRATSFEKAWAMLQGMFIPQRGLPLPLHSNSLWVLVGVVIVCHLLAQRDLWIKLMEYVPGPMRGMGYATAMTCAMLLAPDSGKTFIYFQF